MLAAARRDPSTLSIGLDAAVEPMIEASRRAIRPQRKGGLPNALFVVASAESLPDELSGRFDAATIRFPWGSLLRGVLGPADGLGPAVRGLLAPHGRLEILLSLTDRDGIGPTLGGPDDAERIGRRWQTEGFRLRAVRPLTAAVVATSGSSWAKRLRVGRDRPGWRLDLVAEAREPVEPAA